MNGSTELQCRGTYISPRLSLEGEIGLKVVIYCHIYYITINFDCKEIDANSKLSRTVY